MLFTKSIHHPVEPHDGYRISVMSRHTENDGVTPDPLITPDKYIEWWKDLAPRPKLVGAYYRWELGKDEEESFREYEKHYREYLSTSAIMEKTRDLAQLALEIDVTILCVEPTAEKCHRRILAEVCQILEPTLRVEHR